MLIFFVILSAILLVVMFGIYKNKKYEWAATWAIVFGVLYGSLMTQWLRDQRSSYDEEEAKTTLEITYRDSVAVDSVVVYKMK